MKIVLLAATGRAGSAILSELIRRDDTIVAVARNIEKLPKNLPKNVTIIQDDLNDEKKLTNIIHGSDVVISAFGPSSNDPRHTTDIAYTDQLVHITEKIVNAVQANKTSRLIVVGGAGSLEFSPGVTVLDSGKWPKPYIPIAKSHVKTFNLLKKSDINWTYFSPPFSILPGERTGIFRIGKDALIRDQQGKSHISFEDYAIALVDEIDHPKYERARFTVGY